jgi:Mn2+/Fe2+ NRAMP family transporter
MSCISFCLFGAALLGSSILVMMTSKQSPSFKKFHNLLDDNQQQIYKSILAERATIYIQSLILGIILAVIVTFNVKKLKKISRVCLFVVIAIVTNYLVYSLYPKSTYMLEHLKSTQQNKAWLAIYKEMKLRCLLGLVLGALGYILLANGVCK